MWVKYDYQYDIAGFVISLILLCIMNSRKTYKTKANGVFLVLLLSIMLTAVLDAISCFTITYPYAVPMWFNYLVSFGYLFLYSECSVIFFKYIDIKAEGGKVRKLVNTICICMTVFYLFAVISSPFTHWFAYFDDRRQYQHGNFFIILYILSFVMLLLEVVLLIIARKKFNRYQIYVSIALILSMALSVFITMLIPRLLIGQMCMAVIMVFIYIAFENPAHYTYKETTCFNRRAFVETIRRRGRDNKPFGIVVFEILDYDYIRHNSGIDLMEKATSLIAEFLCRCFKTNAYALSDDKFAVIVHNDKKAEEVKQLIKEFFVLPINVDNNVLRLNISLIEIEKMDLFFDIDEIEYLINYGFNNCDREVISKDEVQTVIKEKQRREMILHAIKNALENDSFEVYYQPIFDRKAGKFHSAEALIRLIDPELGFINPEELITLAEENGYINQIGELVFRKVCSFMKTSKVRELGISYIEINLSPKQCLEPTLASVFQSIMHVYKIEPSWINLEITETAQNSDNRYWLENVEKLRQCGVEFSIDDYGSGFASADYLIRLPMSIVKIDKTILWSAMKDENAMIVLINTIRMLKDLGKKIVVEGVENEEMIQVLDDNGVDFHQGYYYSKAMPSQEFVAFLQKSN